MLTFLNPAYSDDSLGLFLIILLLFSIFNHAMIFVDVYKCHVAFSLNFVLLRLLESGFISSSVLHNAKDPSSLDVIHKFDVYSHLLMKISHRTLKPCIGFAADVSLLSGVLDVTLFCPSLKGCCRFIFFQKSLHFLLSFFLLFVVDSSCYVGTGVPSLMEVLC